MRYIHLSLVAVVISVSLLLLGGCLGKGTQQPTRLYMLQPLASSATAEEAGAADENFSLLVGPIRIPQYLNRPQIVTRNSENEIHLGVFHHWGEALENNFASALAENLSILLSTDRIALYPWGKRHPMTYMVNVDVIQFDGEFNGNAVLHARWYISGFEEKKPIGLAARNSRLTEPVKGESYETLIVAQSRALEALSREIAAEIKAISQERAGQ